MLVPEKPPGEGGVGLPTWTIEKFKGGRIIPGFADLKPVWMTVHFRFVSLPCHSFLTEGKLKCPNCAIKNTFTQGYVPYLDDGGKPMCCAVREYTRPIVDKLRRYQPITVRKGPDKFHPVLVTPREKSEDWRPGRGGIRTQEEFCHWIIRTFKVPELIEFYGADRPVAAERVPPFRDEENRRRTLELRYQNWLAGKTTKPTNSECDEIADVIPLIEAQYGKTSRNGKH